MTGQRSGLLLWEGRLLGITAATLVVFGVAAVYGASSIWALQNGEAGTAFALRQLTGAVLGFALLLLAARMEYHVWQRLAWPLLGAALLALVIPLLPFTTAIAPEINGARRWIHLGPIRFQPSEPAKFALVAWVAMLAAKKGDAIRSFRRGVLPVCVIVVPLAGLTALEPNLSTAVLLALVAGTVLFVAGAKIGHFLVLGLVAIPVVWHEIVSVQYRLARMVSFLAAGGDGGEASWQIRQSLIGIGSGGAFGVGFGEGLQKLGYLPYAYSDFIFSTIGEEWGFVGITLIVALFVLYVGLGFRLARAAPDAFGTLLGVGLVSVVGIAAILHMAVTLALVPTTGVSLPFVSYGRSGLIMALFGTGVLISLGNGRGSPPGRGRGGGRGGRVET